MIHAIRIIMEVHFPASLKVVSLSPPMAFPKKQKHSAANRNIIFNQRSFFMLIIASGSQLTIEKRKVNANMCARQNQETFMLVYFYVKT